MSEAAVIYAPARRYVVVGLFTLLAAALGLRAVDLQLRDTAFLKNHGEARHLRTVAMPAHRGMITDRHGEPLAISTPVSSVGADPGTLLLQRQALPELARLLGTSAGQLRQTLASRVNREFIYLKRQVDPALAARITALGVPGLTLTREFRRYYPAAEVTAHLVGFTNVDDVGQEGVELAYERELRGEPGAKRVVKDRLGRFVENIESIRQPRDGRTVTLAIDRRLQHLAYRELKAAVQAHRARAGSLVVVDSRTGEVLAMANQPSYNPNNRAALKTEQLRNRAATDLFEPGSTIKPFTIAAALESGAFEPGTPIDTSPGVLKVGRHAVRDVHNYGLMDVTGVITKSSNVGSTRIALALEPAALWKVLDRVGFGAITGSGFPGEASGYLSHHEDWRELDRATLAYGYGVSVTALQLAQAYQVLANGGVMQPLSLRRLEAPGRGERVMSAATASEVLAMLETVVQVGTGQLARVSGYRVAGKTGTVHKSTEGGYARDRYLSLFAGALPVSAPRLVAVVVVDEPSRGEYYGGRVAAPVFARVMADTLRLLDVAPDDLSSLREQTVIYASSLPVQEPSWKPE